MNNQVSITENTVATHVEGQQGKEILKAEKE